MKTLQINKNSWHYKAASFYVPSWNLRDTDSCGYIRYVLLSLFFFSLLFALSAILVASFGFFFAWLLAGFTTGFIVLPEAAVGGAVITFMGFIVLVCEGIKKLWLGKEKKYKEPGPIRQLYRSWKDKYCMQLEFK